MHGQQNIQKQRECVLCANNNLLKKLHLLGKKISDDIQSGRKYWMLGSCRNWKLFFFTSCGVSFPQTSPAVPRY